jgi:hypothetical protein
MRARMGMVLGLLSAAAGASGCAYDVPVQRVQSVTIPVVATAQAPPVCPDGAAWEADRDRCVIYTPVQRVAAPPLDLAHMPDPCGIGSSPADPGLDACDPEAVVDHRAPPGDAGPSR